MHPEPGTGLSRIGDALAWRVRQLAGDQRVDRTIVAIARRWRPTLRSPTFIGITGSAGKTTTKELLLGILSHGRQGVGNPASLNALPEVAKAILRTRRTHDHCVAELSEDRPGVMDQTLALLQPSIGIVTVVQDDHLAAFASRDAMASEMGKLVTGLPKNGTAVLNADDARVLAMAAHCSAKVLTYGVSRLAELRAEEISSRWPERLQMKLVRGSERVTLRTQLCGTHWVPSVLGAIGGALAAGMTLAECAQGVAQVEPFEGRMQPVTTADGVTFIRDDFKAPLWTLDACFEFMQTAQATRKIMVIGELSDVGSKKSSKYARAARLAQEIADISIFSGPWTSSVLKARRPDSQGALCAFTHVRDAAEYVNSITRAGDLILLKGTSTQDHLLRILLARNGQVNCWRDDCARHSFCNHCPERLKPSGLPALPRYASPANAAPIFPATDDAPIGPQEQVIVGLGNPGAAYVGTPHNVGYEVLDRLAASSGLAWQARPEAMMARGSLQGQAVCMLKVSTAMNLIGTGLKQLAQSMSFGPDQCILVYDDLALPLGTVRTRSNGGAGGHRGVASILEAFQTDALRRVKVGVAQAGTNLNRANYVLTGFDTASGPAVALAIALAEVHAGELAKRHSLAKRQ